MEKKNDMDKNIIVVNNGIVLPSLSDDKGGVCDNDFAFINESKNQGGYIKRGGNYDFDRGGVQDSEDKIIFLGYFFKHWGHYLIDLLGRAWILCEPRYKNYKVCFLTRKDIDGNYLRLLELLGVEKNRLIKVNVPTRFREIIIPLNAGLNNNKELFYKPYRYISNICSDDKYSGEKVYLSRCHFKNAMRKEIGEKHIESLFRQNGFKVYYPESLTLDEQIAMFKNADTIACVNGTIPLNVVFGRSSLNLIVLNKTSLPHQNLIKVADYIDIKPTYIDVYREPIKGHPRYLGEGPFWMITTDKLKAYFEKNGLEYHLDKSEGSYLSTIKNYIKYYYLYFIIRLKNKIRKVLRRIRDIAATYYMKNENRHHHTAPSL